MFCSRKYAAYARKKCGLFCFLYFCLNKKIIRHPVARSDPINE